MAADSTLEMAEKQPGVSVKEETHTQGAPGGLIIAGNRGRKKCLPFDPSEMLSLRGSKA